MEKKLQIIHIHRDSKFLQMFYAFANKKFDNKLIFLGDDQEKAEDYQSHLIMLPEGRKQRFQIIKNSCNNADIVVINNLDGFAVSLVNSLNPNVKIIWRFFGWEIYSLEPNLIYSPRSLQNIKSSLQKLIFKDRIKFHLTRILTNKDSFKLAIQRVNYFMGIMDDEHKLLISLGYNLPQFLQVPLPPLDIEKTTIEKSKLIVFGNSRNRANNHLDILAQLNSNSTLDRELQIKMFFNYGAESDYTKEVRREASKNSQIEMIETFLPRNKFDSIYFSAAALIFNGYRQMAMDNIFTALAFGVKIYLSERNAAYHWLIKNGIKVFSIEHDLMQDLRNDNYFLSQEDNYRNIDKLMQVSEENSFDKLHSTILNF